MTPTRKARRHLARSPTASISRRSQRPRTASRAAFLRAMKGLTQPAHSSIPSAASSSSFSPGSASGAASAADDQPMSDLPMEVDPPVEEETAPMRKGIPEEGGVGAGTPSMRPKQELEVVLEEAEAARIQNRFDEGESSGSSITSWTERRNQRANMAGEAKKVPEALIQGDRVLRGKRTGVTKNKKVAPKLGEFGLPKKGANLGLDDADTPDRAISPASGSTDVSMKDSSPGSGDVSMGDPVGGSPEASAGRNRAGKAKEDVGVGDPAGGSPEASDGRNRAGKAKGLNAMNMVRTIGRHLAIFIAAVQDSTNGLRDNAEYRAWRDFLGGL